MKHNLNDVTFLRQYAVNFRKNLTFPLGEMTFTNNFIAKGNGEPYPVTLREGEVTEAIENGALKVCGQGRICRVLGAYFPFAAYEVAFSAENGSAGFVFADRGGESPAVEITCDGKTVTAKASGCEPETFAVAGQADSLVVSARGRFFDIYTGAKGCLTLAGIFQAPCFERIQYESVFRRYKAEVCVHLQGQGSVTLHAVKQYMDCGIAQADIRPIRYEDGTPMLENGRLFFTLSVRQEEGGYQGVVSVCPTGCDFRMEGALFFDCGDGMWASDVAASVLYDRCTGQWLIWVCSFSHGHILGHATSQADVRHGVNVLDIKLMEPAAPTDDITAFKGFEGDEDPDFYYDAGENAWYLAICRTVPDETGRHYKYFRFRSDNPFEGFRFVERTFDGADTGGSFVKVGKKRYFVCGTAWNAPSLYKCCPADDFTHYTFLKFDYPDGGFRGWGTVVALPKGSRLCCRLYTFDRMRGSDFTWSYGNLYCFEADDYLSGE